MKVPVLLLLLSLCSSLALAWQTDTDAGSGRPYHYGEESFRHWTRSRQGRFSVLERFTHELLKDAVGKYRVAELEAAPRAFLQPRHCDADEVVFVKQGEGVVVLLRDGRRESFCVREGDVMVIPAGAVVYSANTHQSEWFSVVMLLSPVVSTSGRFEKFFPIGGENPESFLGVFSDDVIQASFNTRREEWGKVFEKQSKGEITTASEEQIRELRRSCSRGGRSSRGEGGDSGPSSSSSKWVIKPSSLTDKMPTQSNSYGRHYEITGDECPSLRLLDMDVGLTDIARGSMMAPSYNTRANKIAIVLNGEGYFEMACPHVSGGRSSQRRERGHGREEAEEREEEQGGGGGGGQKSRSYRQVKSRIGEGSVIVIPAGHPTVLVAGKDKNLAVLSFEVNAKSDEKVFLAGTNSVLQQMDRLAKLLSFGADEEQVDRVIGAQKDAVFLRGPQSRRVSSV